MRLNNGLPAIYRNVKDPKLIEIIKNNMKNPPKPVLFAQPVRTVDMGKPAKFIPSVQPIIKPTFAIPEIIRKRLDKTNPPV